MPSRHVETVQAVLDAFCRNELELAASYFAEDATLKNNVVADVKRSGYDGLLPAGIVLTGGTANLVGIDAFARDLFRMPVRVGRPRGLRGLTDTVSDPAYATSVGLLLWGLKASELDAKAGPLGKRRSGSGDFARRLFGWARELLPQ